MQLLKLVLVNGANCAFNPQLIEGMEAGKSASCTRVQIGGQDWIVEGPYSQIVCEWEEALGVYPQPRPDLDDEIPF